MLSRFAVLLVALTLGCSVPSAEARNRRQRCEPCQCPPAPPAPAGDAGTPTPPTDGGSATADAGQPLPAPDAGVADAGVPDAGVPDAGVADAGTPAPTGSYDQLILGAKPVAYFAMVGQGTELDLANGGAGGSYKGGRTASDFQAMPNGDVAAHFNGTGQYMTVPSRPSFSIPTTGKLTWEGWIRPDVLDFPKQAGPDNYVDWMGKCQEYNPTCEWEARMYSLKTGEGRPNRFSAYAFNPDGNLGSGADWQPVANTVKVGAWYHIVGEYDLTTTASDCDKSYPGMLSIWVNGTPWNRLDKGRTGCMSQYKIKPTPSSTPLNVGTMAFDTFFKGSVGKVAIYNRLLTDAEVKAHYKAMTGKDASGSCGANTCSLNP